MYRRSRTQGGSLGRFVRIAGALACCLAGLLLLTADLHAPPRYARAQAPESKPAGGDHAIGRLIRIPLPITGLADVQVKRAVRKALSEMPRGNQRGTLVFEFASSENQTGRGSDFGRSLDLARFLASSETSAAKTVAYIPGPLKGHAVLVAMACEEIIMAPDATIGQAGIDQPPEEPIDATERSGYQEIANRRGTIPGEVALGMLDKNAEVLTVETEVSLEFVLASNLDELKKKHTITAPPKPLKRPGELAEFTGREARELGFVKYLASDRQKIAGALSLGPAGLEDDPSLVGDWHPVRVALKGPITAQTVSRVERTIGERMRRDGANFICLSIDSPGGSLTESMNLANFLAELEGSKVRTVAYVDSEALSDAALVALACDQLVMHPDAVLGGSGATEFSPEEIQAASETVRESLAAKKKRSWSLLAATFDPSLRVFRFKHRGDAAIDYFCDAELQAQSEPESWNRLEEVTQPRKPLSVIGERAHELGLARYVVPDFTAFKELYGLEDEMVLAEPGWADYLIDALAAPTVAWLLLLIGGAALYAELQAPGIGIGGFVAGLCFLLYFWSRHLEGTAGWLEVLLFAAGVCCILIELFVLPGSAVFGLGGGALVIASLVLASQTFVVPRNDYQIAQLQNSLLGLLGVGAGIVAVQGNRIVVRSAAERV